MKEARTKLWIALLVVAVIWLVSLGLSNIMNFEGTTTADKIVIIPIKGELTSEGEPLTTFGSGTASASAIINYIEQADKDPTVKGIILEINSPGGTVLAGKGIADAVKKTKKPTVALITDVGASGAYWAASAADKIVADPMSITGSIGVTSSYLEFSGLMEKYGIGYEELKAGQYKEAGSPFRKLTDEERASLQRMINKIQDYFINEISKNRNFDAKTIQELKKADVYLGTEAYELNMIDYLGGKDLAINITKQMANIEDAKLVRYEQKKGLLDIIGMLSAQSYYNIGRGIGTEIINRQKTSSPLEIRL